MTERDYDKQLADLKTFAASTEFDFLLTVKDDRPNSSFKLTDFAEAGYTVRNAVVKEAYNQLRISFGLKDFKNSPSIAYIAVHESGMGNQHILEQNKAHLHILYHFNRNSRNHFSVNDTESFDSFLSRMHRAYPFLNFCISKQNDEQTFKIQSQDDAINYITKKEYGYLNGGPFSKSPIVYGFSQN